MVDCISHSLSLAEKNYDIHNKELLTVVSAFKAWQKYLLGNQNKTEVISDHANLSYFQKPNLINAWQNCWIAILSMFNFIIKYCPRKTHLTTNALSCCPNHGNSPSMSTMVALPPTLFTSASFATLDDQVKEAQKQFNGCLPSGVIPDEEKGYQYCGKLWIPNDLVPLVLSYHHSTPTFGHPGTTKTLALLGTCYNWPGL